VDDLPVGEPSQQVEGRRKDVATNEEKLCDHEDREGQQDHRCSKQQSNREDKQGREEDEVAQPKGIDGVGFQQALAWWADAGFTGTVVEGHAEGFDWHPSMQNPSDVRPVTHVVNRGTNPQLPRDSEGQCKQHWDEQNAQR